MKKIFIFLMLILITLLINAQEGKKFNYKLSKVGKSYIVTPIGLETQVLGTMGMAQIKDTEYITELIERSLNNVITKEKRDKFNTSTSVIFDFNKSGEIFNCRFLINKLDKDLFPESVLIDFCNNLQGQKIDLSKVKIIIFPDSDVTRTPDYAEIVYSLASKEAKEKVRKEFLEKYK